jgi:hypothetical protein
MTSWAQPTPTPEPKHELKSGQTATLDEATNHAPQAMPNQHVEFVTSHSVKVFSIKYGWPTKPMRNDTFNPCTKLCLMKPAKEKGSKYD